MAETVMPAYSSEQDVATLNSKVITRQAPANTTIASLVEDSKAISIGQINTIRWYISSPATVSDWPTEFLDYRSAYPIIEITNYSSIGSIRIYGQMNSGKPGLYLGCYVGKTIYWDDISNVALNSNLSKVGHTTIITATTLADLKTNLLDAVNGVASGDMLAVRIAPSFSSDGFTSGSTYGGYAYNIYKANGTTSYFSVILSNNIGEDMFIGYNNGTWKFNSLNSKLPQANETLYGNVITAANNARVGITFYYNSNEPTNMPPNSGYGTYIFFKSSATHVRVIYVDTSGTFAEAAIDPTTATSIPWQIIRTTLKTGYVINNSFMLYRSAGSVFGACLGGNYYSCDSANGVVKYNGTAITVPSGYRPLYGVDVRDTLNNLRIFISPDGTISAAEAFTARAIRFSTTWMTNDTYPT